MNRIHQWLRYGTVSIVATLTGMTVLGVLVSTTSMSAALANVIATAFGTVPSFELNRRWVWRKTGKRSLSGEVAPFWLLSFAGLALSTVAVGVAATWAAHAAVGAAARTLVIETANLAAFGSLWIVQFLVLDRILFRAIPTPLPVSARTHLTDKAA